MNVQLRIQRYDPDADMRPHWETYPLEANPRERVLDLLHRVKDEIDGSLTFRRSCGHGVCGSDALEINGHNRLACKTLVMQVGTTISVGPLPALPLIKDLVVDLDGFFERHRSVRPWFINDAPPPARERAQDPAQRALIEETSRCILCAACTSSCPSFWAQRSYVGPAAIVQAHRFIFDSRDTGGAERLDILADRSGVWHCRTIFNCVDACPVGIDVTRAILEVTGAILERAS